MRSALLVCVLATYGRTGAAQSGQPGVFHEAGTGLTMRYPVELVVRDAQKAFDEGHIAAFENEAKEHNLAGRCMKPLLLAEFAGGAPRQGNQPLEVSTATLLLFQFIASNECNLGRPSPASGQYCEMRMVADGA